LSPLPTKSACVALTLAWIVGAALRAKDLGTQIVVGDETHALRAALSQDAAYIATHNSLPGEIVDYSIPLALWNLLLMRTVGLDEWSMRLPVLLAGVVMIPVVSVFVWRAVGKPAGVLVARWFACAPVFIHYSRLARPYAPVALLTMVALLGWLRWRRSGGWLPGATAAGSGALATYFSLAGGPAVVVWGCGLIFAARAARVRWAVIALAGAVLAAAALVPSLAAQHGFIAGIRARSSPTLLGWWGCARIAFGTKSDCVAGLLLAITVLGAVIAVRRHPAVTSTVLLMMAAQVAACAGRGHQAAAPARPGTQVRVGGLGERRPLGTGRLRLRGRAQGSGGGVALRQGRRRPRGRRGDRRRPSCGSCGELGCVSQQRESARGPRRRLARGVRASPTMSPGPRAPRHDYASPSTATNSPSADHCWNQ
jgi:hypothetical protein